MGVTAEKDERVAIIKKDLLAYIEAVEDIRRRIDTSIGAQINLRKMLGLNEKPKSVVNLQVVNEGEADDMSEAGSVTTTNEWWLNMLKDVVTAKGMPGLPPTDNVEAAASEEWAYGVANDDTIAGILTKNNAVRNLKCWKRLQTIGEEA